MQASPWDSVRSAGDKNSGCCHAAPFSGAAPSVGWCVRFDKRGDRQMPTEATPPIDIMERHHILDALRGWALAGVLQAELEPSEATAASVAWNKLLLVNPTVLLLGYLPPRRLP